MIAYVRGEGERDYKTILQELASAEVRAVPEYRIRERGPIIRRSSRPRCSSAARSGHRHRPLEEGGRAAGRAPGLRPPVGACRVGEGGDRARQRDARRPSGPGTASARASGSPEEGALVELPEVEVMRRDLEKDVVGRKVAEAEVRPSKNAMR